MNLACLGIFFLSTTCLISLVKCSSGGVEGIEQCVQSKILGELPLYDPAETSMPAQQRHMICSSEQLSVESIYSALNNVLVQFEDALRTANCSQKQRGCGFQIHAEAIPALPLFPGNTTIPSLNDPSCTSPFALFMRKYTGPLLDSAKTCQPDWRIIHKMVRLAMKTLANKVHCAVNPPPGMIPANLALEEVEFDPNAYVAPSSGQVVCAQCSNGQGIPPPPPPYDQLQ